jgi:hypothetical protein
MKKLIGFVANMKIGILWITKKKGGNCWKERAGGKEIYSSRLKKTKLCFLFFSLSL